jgi:uncharacterized phage protein (TIGR01671 family)
MREIKFRAWDGKKILYDEYEKISGYADTCHHLSLTFKGEVFGRSIYDNHGADKLDDQNFALEQFTGLTDRAGVDIYEGDIVTCKDSNDCDYSGEVVFENGTFCLRRFDLNWDGKRELHTMWKDGMHRWRSIENADDFKVIGNVHQNPDLLTSLSKTE